MIQIGQLLESSYETNKCPKNIQTTSVNETKVKFS